MQSLILLARTKLDTSLIKSAEKIFNEDENILIKRTASLILISQVGHDNESFTRDLIRHPNDELRKFGNYIHACKTNEKVASILLNQAFKNKYSWLLVDYIPFLYLQSQSDNITIKDNLESKIVSGKYYKKHLNMDMRDLLTQLLSWL